MRTADEVAELMSRTQYTRPSRWQLMTHLHLQDESVVVGPSHGATLVTTVAAKRVTPRVSSTQIRKDQ